MVRPPHRTADNLPLPATYVRQYHGERDPGSRESQEREAELDATPRDEEARTQTCQFRDRSMRLTGSTLRPRVYELLEMPLSRFRQAQAGCTITLGDKLPRIEAQRSGDDTLPAMGERAKEIRGQLIALATTGYL